MVHGLNPTGQDDDAVTVPDVLAAALVTTSGPDTLSPALLPVELDAPSHDFCRDTDAERPNTAPALNEGRLRAVHAAAPPCRSSRRQRRRQPGVARSRRARFHRLIPSRTSLFTLGAPDLPRWLSDQPSVIDPG